MPWWGWLLVGGLGLIVLILVGVLAYIFNGLLRPSPHLRQLVTVTDEKRLVIRVNSNLNWSRGKMAAHAVHAALKLYGIEHEHPVIVLGAKPPEILEQAVHVRDAGRTELEPGTLTAGASWDYRTED